MKPEFHCDDQWWVSPSNVTDDVRRSFSLSRRVQIHDATLRDGEQTSLEEFREIAERVLAGAERSPSRSALPRASPA